MDRGWIDICLRVAAKDRAAAEGIAVRFTSVGLYVEDYSDMPLLLPLVGGADYIDEGLFAKDKSTALIHVYLEDSDQADRQADRLALALSEAGLDFSMTLSPLANEDWANDWKKFHPPQKIGRLFLRPSWAPPVSDDGPELILDPGDAFGSGRDETTRLCLLLMQDCLSPGDRMLDIGCGSGILALAALLLGARAAAAVDIEPKAVRAARENAELNGLASRFSAHLGNLLTDPTLEKELGGGYDLICANIVTEVHLAMGGIYAEKLRPGGRLVLSGILTSRARELQEAVISAGFRFSGSREESGWTALSFEKEGNKK